MRRHSRDPEVWNLGRLSLSSSISRRLAHPELQGSVGLGSQEDLVVFLMKKEKCLNVQESARDLEDLAQISLALQNFG